MRTSTVSQPDMADQARRRQSVMVRTTSVGDVLEELMAANTPKHTASTQKPYTPDTTGSTLLIMVYILG